MGEATHGTKEFFQLKHKIFRYLAEKHNFRIFAFEADMGEAMNNIKRFKQTGMLWVSWPKSGQKNTDLNMKSVIKLGYDYGLVKSKCISINSIWSALKFTHPKMGKPIITAMENLKGRL